MSSLSGMVSEYSSSEDESSEELENEYLDEAFAAVNAGDPSAFKRAMKGAFRCCVERLVKPKSLKETEGY